MSDILALDFGTSNSAAATPTAQGFQRIAIEPGAETVPTAVFFPVGERMRIGSAAADALLDGEEGRYMRALKSALGLPLAHEPRLLGGRRRTIAGVIAEFLAETRRRAEAATGRRFRRVLSGRPVRFHTADPAKDEQAERDLRACYLDAGFQEVSFLPEPEAAAMACQGMGASYRIGLIVDIGGGTSDFSVFRSAGARPEILASHGVRLGGTDFDHAVSMTHAMPALGSDGQLRREMGDGVTPMPRALYFALATWSTIPFLYTPEMRREAKQMARLAVEAAKVSRLAAVLERELGHELAFAVERGKIAANRGDAGAEIAMEFIEEKLAAAFSVDSIDAALFPSRAVLRAAAAEAIEMAGVAPASIGRIILVGGSSLMAFVSDEMRALCPEAEILRSAAFTAVIDGLALSAGR